MPSFQRSAPITLIRIALVTIIPIVFHVNHFAIEIRPFQESFVACCILSRDLSEIAVPEFAMVFVLSVLQVACWAAASLLKAARPVPVTDNSRAG